jgi:predicted AlkP superfamily pyrophosphatase or phosphodiesterase
MTRSLVALVLLAFTSCSPVTTTAPPAAAPAPTQGPARFAPIGTAQRVVLISYDGLGADQLAAQTQLPTFDWLAIGATTARIIPVNPTTTAVTHTSILTGATPERHGIVSNRFHLPGTPPEKATMGMDIESDVETLVDAAKRQGKRTGCIPFPTMDGSTARRTCDFGMAWSEPAVKARTIELTPAQFKREWVPPTWTARPQHHTSYSPILRARLEWAVPGTPTPLVRADVDFVAYDTTNDRTTNYDAIYVEADGDEVPVDANGWFAVARRSGDDLYGSWSKVLRADAALEHVTVYWGEVSRNEAWPAAFKTTLNDEIGFWPGPPNNDVDADTFIQQSERLATFLARVHALALQRMPADLFLLYQPGIDEAQHQFLDTPQVVRSAFETADRTLNQVASLLDYSRDALIVTGDHGLGRVQSELRINRVLAANGLAPRWRAYTSGSVAQLYRFAEPDDTDAVAALFRGRPQVDRVEKKTAASHRNSGDLVVYTLPSVAASSSSEAPDVAPADHPGQHGGLNTHRELHTILFARGEGVARGDFGELSQTKIARFVSALLGIAPPSAAE